MLGKEIIAALRRYAARVRAGFVLFLVGEGLRFWSLHLGGKLPAPVALAGTVALGLAFVMVWSGIDGFAAASMQGFSALAGEEPPPEGE